MSDDVDLLTELYSLRSHAGVLRSHAQRQHALFTASSCAIVMEELTRSIQRMEAQIREPQTPLPLATNVHEKSRQFPGEN